MKAIISDIHGNLEALQVVLDDISHQKIDDGIYCLGDVIGYGPNPRECIDLVMDCKLVLLGNHDQGALFDPDGFNPAAERAILWTRDQLEQPAEARPSREKRWEFLADRPRVVPARMALLFVHGSARNPLNEYVFPEDIYNQRKMEKIFTLVEKYCFQGHTHVPGIFTESMQFLLRRTTSTRSTASTAARRCATSAPSASRAIGDPRACYVLYDGETIRYRRVEYDFEVTIRKIYDIPDLDNFLGDRSARRALSAA